MGKWGDITNIAARQGGFILRAQLLDLGVSNGSISRKVASGDLTVISDSVYQVFAPSTHLDLMRGAHLALPQATVSHQSAAHLLELPYLPELAPTVTVASHTTHRFPDVLVRRNDDIADSHVTEVEGLPVTSVARTAFDLAAVLKFREFERVAEAAILAGRLHTNDLDTLLEQLARRGKPGVLSVRTFVEVRSGGPEDATVLERKGRRVLTHGGLPLPEPQYPMPWNQWRRFDDAYPNAKVAIEWDSRTWHAQQEAMTSDRQRDRDAATHGWIIVRFTWYDVTKNPHEVVSTVAKLLRQRTNVA